MVEVFKKKEQIDFYINTLNEINFSCSPIKEISQSQIKIQISHFSQTIDLIIKNYKYGIVQFLFDLPDKTLKYKNSNDIGLNLEEKSFTDVHIKENNITLITEDDIEDNFPYGQFKNLNKYKIIIYLSDFKIEYLINDDLLFTFNREKMLNLLFKKDNNLKSNFFDFSYHNITKCFGLPERNSSFFLPDFTYRSFNLDNPWQKVGDNLCLYGSIPMLYGINNKNIITVFNNNTSDQFITLETEDNKNRKVKWITEGGIINLYIFSDNIIERQLKKTYRITGNAPMAPIWAFGYHHCRWGFQSDEDVMNVANKFEELKIPFDCIWLDIDHTDDKKYFTWNPKTFKNVKNFLQKLNDSNRFFVTIIDPHLKVNESYDISNKLKESDCLVKEKNSKGELVNYIGHCWPGSSYYGDFINYEKLLKEYKEFYKKEDYFMNFNNFGTWVDMNEPSVFDDNYEKTMPRTNIHFDGKQQVEHREIHNIYGYYYQKCAFNSLLNRFNNKTRPFILSRSYYAGSHKNGWIWTGDQGATYDFMNTSIELNFTNGLCGISGCGTDVGGFLNSPTPDLLKSWYNLGFLYIFFRGHSAFNTIRREPWLFEEDIKNSIIESIKLRYNLLMFFYSKFYDYTLNGVSIMKPLWMIFKDNEKLFEKLLNLEEQGSLFVLGKEILAVNNYYITEKSIQVINEIKDEDKILYELFTGEKMNGKFKKDEKLMTQKIALGGSVIPWTEKNELCSYYVMRAPISIKIFLDNKKKARGYYYFDDGMTWDNEGHYAYIEILACENKINIRNINVSNDVGSGKLKDIIPIWNYIEIYGLENDIKEISLEDKKQLKYERLNNKGIKISLIDEKIKAFDPITINIK